MPNVVPTSNRNASDADLQRTRTVTTTAAALCAALYALLWDAPLSSRLILLAIAEGVVLSRSPAALAAFLVLTWGRNLLAGPEWTLPQDLLTGIDVISSILLLAYVLCVLRDVELRREHAMTGVGRRVALRPFAGWAWPLIAAPAVALLLLWLVPLEAMFGNAPDLKPPALRAAVLGWVLAGAALVASAVFAVLRWRRLSAPSAAVYVRTVLAEELRRELASAERARARRIRKRVGRR